MLEINDNLFASCLSLNNRYFYDHLQGKINKSSINCNIILSYRNQARNNEEILKFYSMEQEITHYSCGKLHVG